MKKLVAVLLLVLIATSGYWLYISISPKEKTISVPLTVAKLKTKFSGYAIVTEDNPVWNKGEKLRDKPLYIITASPVYNFTFSATLVPENGTAKNISVTTEVVYFSKYGDSIIWSKRYASENATGVERCENSMSVNFGEIQDRIVSIEKGLGYRGKTGIAIVNTVKYEVARNGKVIEGEKKVSVPVSLDSNTYSVSDSEDEKIIAVNVNKNVRVSPSARDLAPPVALLSMSVVALCALAASDRIIRYVDDPLRKYGSIVSRGEIRNFSGNAVDVKSLKDLFGVALDTGERVIESDDSYFVIHGDTAYVFRKS